MQDGVGMTSHFHDGKIIQSCLKPPNQVASAGSEMGCWTMLDPQNPWFFHVFRAETGPISMEMSRNFTVKPHVEMPSSTFGRFPGRRLALQHPRFTELELVPQTWRSFTYN